jgi:hypothetical protein
LEGEFLNGELHGDIRYTDKQKSEWQKYDFGTWEKSYEETLIHNENYLK